LFLCCLHIHALWFVRLVICSLICYSCYSTTRSTAVCNH
jgi:hypothetical protein